MYIFLPADWYNEQLSGYLLVSSPCRILPCDKRTGFVLGEYSLGLYIQMLYLNDRKEEQFFDGGSRVLSMILWCYLQELLL